MTIQMKREQSKPQARSSFGKWLTKISASPRPSVAQTPAEYPRCPGRLPRAGVSGRGVPAVGTTPFPPAAGPQVTPPAGGGSGPRRGKCPGSGVAPGRGGPSTPPPRPAEGAGTRGLPAGAARLCSAETKGAAGSDGAGRGAMRNGRCFLLPGKKKPY